MAGKITGALAAAGLAVGVATGSVAVAHADPTVLPSPAPAPTMTATGGAQAAGTSAATSTASGSAAGSAASGTSAGTSASGNAAASGDVLDQLAQEYSVGSGGGQLSNLLKTCLQLRAMGFRPSKANLEEIAKAESYRPNQLPLIAALKDTIAYQGKIKAQMEILQQYQQNQANSAVMGAGQMPADSNPANLPGAPQGTGPMAPSPAAPMLPGAPPSP